MPTHDAPGLTPPVYKHTYAPDVEPSTLISDEVVFRVLTRIDWSTTNFQPLGEEEADEPVLDEPQPSPQQDQES